MTSLFQFLHFWCLVCRAYRADAECETCGNACQLKPDWSGTRG